jgi:cytoskeletal protein CcmA (bactofilin family)
MLAPKIYNSQGKLVELFKEKTNKITMIYGNAMIDGNHTWEFGQGVTKSDYDAGKIGYAFYSQNGFDIVGATSSSHDNKNKNKTKTINIEDNLNIDGSLEIQGDLTGNIHGGQVMNQSLYLQNYGINVNDSKRVKNGGVEGDYVHSRGDMNIGHGLFGNKDLNVMRQLCVGEGGMCIGKDFLNNPTPAGERGPEGPVGTSEEGVNRNTNLKLNTISIGSTKLTEDKLKQLLSQIGSGQKRL